MGKVRAKVSKKKTPALSMRRSMRKLKKKTPMAGAKTTSKRLYTGKPGELPPKYERTAMSLNSSVKIQAFLDKMPYDPSDEMRSVLQTFELGSAHCFAGALMAAYCLGRHGYGARVVGMNADGKIDDGHMLAVYQKNGLWGSVSKSNYNGLRGRDPVYASVRELLMSYFEFHVNPDGLKSLRSWSDPLDLDQADPKRDWVFLKSVPSGARRVARLADLCPHRCYPTGFKTKDLAVMQGKTMKAQLVGCNAAGLFHGP